MPVSRLKPPRVAAIEPGDVFAAITDGIFEYENAAGAMFGDERVVDLVRGHPGSTAREIIDIVVGEVDAFAAGAPQKDDMTLVVVRRKPG